MPANASIFRTARKSPHVIFSLESSLPIACSTQSTFYGWKLPYPEVLRPFGHVLAFPADILRPTIMIGTNLFHEEGDSQISAFVSHSPYPGRLHAACTGARLAATDDPIWDTCVRL